MALLLVDARRGVVEQTQRHTAVLGLLRVQHLVVAVNKIDLVDHDERRFSGDRRRDLRLRRRGRARARHLGPG